MRVPRWSFQNCALTLASVLLSLALAEVALRILAPKATQIFRIQAYTDSEKGKFCQFHPVLGWVGRPNVDDVFDVIDCRHRVRQNRHGFRGSEYAFARSSRTRLVVLGDSFVWGFGVEDEQMFTRIVERNSDPPVELVNLGVSGYGTDQQYLLWQELGQRFQPDRVLIVVTPYTDLWDNRSDLWYGTYPKPAFRADGNGGYELTNVPVPEPGAELWEEKRLRQRTPRKSHWLGRAASHSALLGSVLVSLSRDDWLRERLESRGILPERSGAYVAEQMLYVEPQNPAMQQNWELLFAILEKLVTAVRASGAEPLVAMVPSVVQVYPELWERLESKYYLAAGQRWDRELPNRRIAAYCEERGIRNIDLLPSLRQAGEVEPYLYFPWNRHWTEAGNRVVADILLRELSRSPR